MNKHYKITLSKLACAICMIICANSFANQQSATVSNNESSASGGLVEIPGIFNLPDKLNHDRRRLDLNSPVHIHKFTAVRGQDVLVQVQDGLGLSVERLDGQVWKRVGSEGDVVRNLTPGAEVIVSVAYAGLPQPGGILMK